LVCRLNIYDELSRFQMKRRIKCFLLRRQPTSKRTASSLKKGSRLRFDGDAVRANRGAGCECVGKRKPSTSQQFSHVQLTLIY